MANTDIPKGFIPVPPVYHVGQYSVDASNGTAIFRNDMVMGEDDGNIAPATAASAALLGSSYTYLAAETAGTCLVADDPHQKFIAQDDAGGTVAQTIIHTYADHAAGAGNAYTKLSGHEIDGSSYGTTTTGFRILDIVNREDNEAGDQADLRVMIYDHIHGKTGV